MTEPQIMIVTGGSRGIGAATARLAAQRGYDVCVNYLGNAEGAESGDDSPVDAIGYDDQVGRNEQNRRHP